MLLSKSSIKLVSSNHFKKKEKNYIYQEPLFARTPSKHRFLQVTYTFEHLFIFLYELSVNGIVEK